MEIAALEFAAETAAHNAEAAEIAARLREHDSEHKESHEPFRSAMTVVYKYSALSAATGLIPVHLARPVYQPDWRASQKLGIGRDS